MEISILQDLNITSILEFNISYPKVQEFTICGYTTFEFDLNVQKWNEAIFWPLSHWDSYTLEDLDGFTLGEMEINV